MKNIMFPIKNLIVKLKHILNVRGVLNQLLVFGIFLFLVCFGWSYFHSSVAFVPKSLREYLWFPEGYKLVEKQFTEAELDRLLRKIEKLNLNAEVLNWEKHGAVHSETTMIAVQVHKDVERLQFLIISLGQVQHIQQVLLVFSHSYYDEQINNLVKSINFCKVMQIFFPYSVQLSLNRFPGVDPDDCNSTGANSNSECFQRDAHRTESKHHWWWKAHHVFDGLEMTSSKRVVIFLEETDYVLPDFLHTLKYLRRALAYFPTAEVMALGRMYAENLDYDAVIVDSWTPLRDRGLAFNISTWQKIKERASLYCMYDDCSWSYSLVHLFKGFQSGFVDMVTCMAPRVLPTGTFGSGREAARWAGSLAQRAPLFPGGVHAVVTVGAFGRVRRGWRPPPHGNGGWGDLRDQMLCLDPPLVTVNEINANTMPFSNPVVKNQTHSNKNMYT